MISAVISEFNPFHNGHAYLLNKAKLNSEAVICIMSGNFVQRGEIAVLPKHLRAKAAIKNGADMVIALPAGWSMSGAENFAFGAVSLIKSTKIINNLVFGCENDDINLFNKTVEILGSNKIDSLIKSHLNSGVTYAVARKLAVETINKDCANLLTLPNNILAVEYLSAINKLGLNINISPIKRIATQHDSTVTVDNFSSASNIRKMLLNGDNLYSHFIPDNAYEIIKNSEYSNISILDKALLFKLRSLTINDITNLPDISEGIENRIYEAIKNASTIEDLYLAIKTKRYTLSRIKRIIMSACFGIDNSFLNKEPPYIQVLAVNSKGKELLSEISKKATIPIIVSGTDKNKLDTFGKKVFDTEATADDLYGLAFNTPKNCGSAYTQPLIKE